MKRSDRDTDGPGKMDLKLSYTCSKDEDRAAFIRHFVDYVERAVKRSHESKVRRQIKTAAFQALTAEQKQALKDSKPDYRSIWDRIPSMLAGEDFATSPAYEWWCAAYEKEGMMASTAFRILEDISVRDSFQGSEWRAEGTSTRDLTGIDGTEGTHCKMVADSMSRQNIEYCIKLPRIREYKDRVSEQLRVQFAAPTKVTWKDLELGIDLPEVVAAIRLSGTAKKADAGNMRKDFKKKEPAAPAGEEEPKKPTREAHNAERAKNSYNKVPPPDARKDKDAYVPQDFHKRRRLHSIHEHEVNNAKMREYNLKHMFPKHKMGITTEEWLKLPEAKQQRAAASAEVQSRLTVELSSMQTAGQAGGGDGAGAQALSEDELEYDSNCNEREEYAAVDRISSAGEEEVINDHSEGGSMPELQARATVALGNTQKMQGFPEDAPDGITSTELQADVHADRSNNGSPGYDTPAQDIDALLALEEIEGRGSSEPVGQAVAEVNEHQVHDPPETVLSKAGDVATRVDVQADIQELSLDEMPDGVVDLVTARWAAACVDNRGVVDFSEHGHVRVRLAFYTVMK
ncbi:hypothetical protein CYMTET_26189 [Cymbomonas tetramitiformis]|uniref:Uncharacterized protein n=1 Tax=Cymbomonas tetramitiformis TaxID=36881 RepID=A0AAE0FSS8_9CHLO|nr:hypothetical protein CYMTET_26189 [Cymbomonas tetramitiformis]